MSACGSRFTMNDICCFTINPQSVRDRHAIPPLLYFLHFLFWISVPKADAVSLVLGLNTGGTRGTCQYLESTHSSLLCKHQLCASETCERDMILLEICMSRVRCAGSKALHPSSHPAWIGCLVFPKHAATNSQL